MTSENLRFHAAGHIAAALVATEFGHAEAAKKIMQIVLAFASHTTVTAPPQMIAKIAACAEAPNSDDLRLLEQWFVDPLNTVIERSAA